MGLTRELPLSHEDLVNRAYAIRSVILDLKAECESVRALMAAVRLSVAADQLTELIGQVEHSLKATPGTWPGRK